MEKKRTVLFVDDDYLTKPFDASEIIAEHYDITPEGYREQIAGLKWYSYEEQIQESEAGDWVSAFNVISEIKFANGRIPRKPNAAKAIDRTLLEGLYENS